MRTSADPRDIFQKLVDGVAAQRWAELPNLYAEDAIVRHPFAVDSSAMLKGREQLREHFAKMGAISLVVSVHDVVTHQTSDPEVIIAEFAYHGHVGRADKSFKLPAIFVLRVRAGEIVESRDYFGQRQSLDAKPE